MSDIFREVEEDVRRDRFAKFWKAWGNVIIALGVLAFLGVGAWEVWDRHDRASREKAASQFIAAQRISNANQAANAFVDMKDAPKGYAELARLAQAGAMLTANQKNEAIDIYKQLANDDSGPIGMVARLRAAWAMADTASRSELGKLLEPLNQPGSAWRENALEVLAYADYRALDVKSAQAKYAELAADPEAPDALRGRAKAMNAFLKSGGAVNFGTVPVDATPLPPQAQANLPPQVQAALAAAQAAKPPAQK